MPPKLELIVNYNRELTEAARHGELRGFAACWPAGLTPAPATPTARRRCTRRRRGTTGRSRKF